MDREEALKLIETKWWESATSEDIALFQLNEKRLCCPFDVFQKAVEEAIGRPVFTHEFANPASLRAEIAWEVPTRTLKDILELIPEEKRVILVVDD